MIIRHAAARSLNMQFHCKDQHLDAVPTLLRRRFSPKSVSRSSIDFLTRDGRDYLPFEKCIFIG
jgi:hypothetical protein